jgi:lysophospholipase L1-like esterase
MMRILIRGGSIAAGYGVGRGYADSLREYCASKGIALINQSCFKENSFDGIRSFDEDVDPFKPEILVVHFGVDDAFECVYRSEFKENLVTIVKRARSRFNPLIVMPTSQPFENPYDMQAVYNYYRIIREVCKDLNCEVVSVHTYWASWLEENRVTHSDLVHDDVRYPNERGHEVFAHAIIQRLEKIIPSYL